jgi:hypothetical protein
MTYVLQYPTNSGVRGQFFCTSRGRPVRRGLAEKLERRLGRSRRFLARSYHAQQRSIEGPPLPHTLEALALIRLPSTTEDGSRLWTSSIMRRVPPKVLRVVPHMVGNTVCNPRVYVHGDYGTTRPKTFHCFSRLVSSPTPYATTPNSTIDPLHPLHIHSAGQDPPAATTPTIHHHHHPATTSTIHPPTDRMIPPRP